MPTGTPSKSSSGPSRTNVNREKKGARITPSCAFPANKRGHFRRNNLGGFITAAEVTEVPSLRPQPQRSERLKNKILLFTNLVSLEPQITLSLDSKAHVFVVSHIRPCLTL